LATEARPAFIAITGRLEHETLDAVARFVACLHDASGEAESNPAVVVASTLAARAFAGDPQAWAPLVAAVRQLLAGSSVATLRGLKSRRELRAFVAENADLLQAGD